MKERISKTRAVYFLPLDLLELTQKIVSCLSELGQAKKRSNMDDMLTVSN